MLRLSSSIFWLKLRKFRSLYPTFTIDKDVKRQLYWLAANGHVYEVFNNDICNESHDENNLIYKATTKNHEREVEFRSDQFWAFLLVKSKPMCIEMYKIISYVYSIPCSNAFVEGGFNQRKSAWTASRNLTISSSSMNSNETQMARKDERVVSSLFARSLENNSTRDLTEEKITFIWLQILTNVLIYMPKLEEDAQNEMIVLCRQENKNDQAQLKLIEEFFNEYKLSEAIRCDVYRQINDLFTPIIDKLRSFRVYRGQNMSISELETLRGNVGGVISMNSFVSTSREENDALCFIQGAVPEPGFAIVLFEMAIDTRIAKIADTPFANIQDHSYIPDEEEILLSMGTIFRIDSIEREQLDSSNIWRIKTTMCTINDDPQIKMLIDYAKNSICSRETMTFFTYGKFLAYMSRYDSSVVYYLQLLNQLPPYHIDLPTIHNDLAYAYRESKCFSDALKHFNIAIALKEKQISRDDVTLAETYSDLGWLLTAMNDLTKSLKLHQKAIAIRGKYLGDNHIDTAMSYECLGIYYLKINDFDVALFYLQEALTIRQRCLPALHPYLAMSYSSFGAYFNIRKDHVEALKMYEQAISIYKNSMPPTHSILAETYISLGDTYLITNQLEKAIKHLKSALIIYRKSNFRNQAIVHKILGFAYYKLRDYKQAFVSYENALQLAREEKNNTLATSVENSIRNLHVRELAEFQNYNIM
ncbi:unnamed protein product [Rotaria socialis]|uniref:ADP ribosyltransferase domain-containing protein n=3 Tax=Rotaria socialis TaxID=392032 RepID=A0A820CV06_9BILA|nr:unnamed protein product [Rotaria socialis]